MELKFGTAARKDLEKLPLATRARILEALAWYSRAEDPFVFARRLRGRHAGYYRFRIGSYRAICSINRGIISVGIIENRKDIYR